MTMPPSVQAVSISTIREQIEDSLVISTCQRRFLPADRLSEILTLHNIKESVKELNHNPNDRINLADTIHREGKQVFAMLVYDKAQDRIINFRKHGILDKQLPLSEETAKRLMGNTDGRRLAAGTQWMFLPYIFPERMYECRLQIDRRMILPFTSAEKIGAGAFGDVERISIAPSQHNFTNKGAIESHVVQKRLQGSDLTEDFGREDKCLRLLNQLQHPNIIPFWGSYTYGEEHNFLFPYIGMDLGKFLMTQDRHGMFHWDFTFYSAITGLASALSNVHNLRLKEDKHDIGIEAIGYHHDLRPPNVLVSDDTFILADFGLGNLKDPADPSHTPFKSISGDYVAPECRDMEEKSQSVNRGIDVWAFGCLIAEVVTYMLKGVEGIREFRKKRMTAGRLPGFKDAGFYQPHGEVKQEVQDWFETLRRDNAQLDLIPKFLALSQDALQKNRQDRPDMGTMYQRLSALSLEKHFRCVQDQFHRIKGDEKSSAILKHHLESLRIAQGRFDIWGQVLGLCDESIPRDCQMSDFHVSSESSLAAKVMRDVFHELQQEADGRALGDASALYSLQHQIERRVEELWSLLPNSFRLSADTKWRENAYVGGLLEQTRLPSRTVNSGMSHTTSAVSSDFLAAEFDKAVQSFKDDLPDSVPLEELLKAKSIEDVYDTTDKIQVDRELRNLPKIRLYLQRLSGYVGVIQDLTRVNEDIVALIWGPVALLLQWSSTLEKAYDSIIDAVADMGKALPDFSASEAVLSQCPESKEILNLFFKDILNFYHVTLEPFSHSGWRYIFDRSWPKHSKLASEIVSHIERLTRLMRTEIRLEHIQQEYEFRRNALASFRKQAKEARQQEFHRIKTSFNPMSYDNTLDGIRGLCCLEAGGWLFSNETYTKWFNGSQGVSRILWLKGIPGAGKTVLSSTVVSRLESTQRICFAFLTYMEAQTSALSVVHSLIFQLAGRDDDLVGVVCETMDEDLKRDLLVATNFLSSLILHAGLVYLIIDGLDEISEAERSRLVHELLRLVEECKDLRIILSSRPESDLARALDDTAVAIQIHKHNERSIGGYVTQRCESIFNEIQVLPQDRAEIRKLLVPLASRAKGMFLYARLMMDMLATLHDLSEFQDELSILPEDLDAAYHRIIGRLGKRKTKREEYNARRLLGWVACTPTPLTIEAAQQGLIVQSQNPAQDFRIFGKLDVVYLLGPIVEVLDGYIRFVHFTAKEYISSTHLGEQLIDTNQATLDLATQCIGYLCQKHHDPNLPSEELMEKLCSGQYSFHAFSIRMWFELSCQYLRSTPSLDLSPILVKSIQTFWGSRRKLNTQKAEYSESRLERTTVSQDEVEYESEDENEAETERESMFDKIKETQPLLHHMFCRVSRFRDSSFLATGTLNQDPYKNKDDPLSTSDISQCIRKTFDKMLCKKPIGWISSGKPGCHEQCASILYYYGPRPFKCRFLLCDFWQHGFATRSSRDKHERSHDNPLKCLVAGCKFEAIGFLSEKMRRKHMEEGHSSNAPQPNFILLELNQAEIEPLLLDLVQEDRLEAVQAVLAAFPNAIKTGGARHRLQLLASSAASGAMLELLLEPTQEAIADQQPLRPAKETHAMYVVESIKAHNRSAMDYLLAHFRSYKVEHNFDNLWTGSLWNLKVLRQLVSSDWTEGTMMLCKWYRKHITTRIEIQNVQHLIGCEEVVRKAATQPAGNQQLLCLWSDAGILPLSENLGVWAGRTLRVVAACNLSITLADFLLGKGADINYRVGKTTLTALHRAARLDTAEAAEMVRYLLLNGADPEADTKEAVRKKGRRESSKPLPARRIRDEKGARGIHRWLEKTWDELVEETTQIRKNKEAGRFLVSNMG